MFGDHPRLPVVGPSPTPNRGTTGGRARPLSRWRTGSPSPCTLQRSPPAAAQRICSRCRQVAAPGDDFAGRSGSARDGAPADPRRGGSLDRGCPADHPRTDDAVHGDMDGGRRRSAPGVARSRSNTSHDALALPDGGNWQSPSHGFACGTSPRSSRSRRFPRGSSSFRRADHSRDARRIEDPWQNAGRHHAVAPRGVYECTDFRRVCRSHAPLRDCPRPAANDWLRLDERAAGHRHVHCRADIVWLAELGTGNCRGVVSATGGDGTLRRRLRTNATDALGTALPSRGARRIGRGLGYHGDRRTHVAHAGNRARVLVVGAN